MPRYIICIRRKQLKNSLYCEWSTIVDAPITRLVRLPEFTEYYRSRYGSAGMADYDERIARAQATGCSALAGTTLLELIVNNRAGDNETRLTLQQIVKQYK